MYRNNFKHNKSIKEVVNRKEQEANFHRNSGLFPSFFLKGGYFIMKTIFHMITTQL